MSVGSGWVFVLNGHIGAVHRTLDAKSRMNRIHAVEAVGVEPTSPQVGNHSLAPSRPHQAKRTGL